MHTVLFCKPIVSNQERAMGMVAIRALSIDAEH